ncbi:MAG TPA: NAD(+) synthase [Dehalococcoidales bacterium]|nr:NAD(+) synthase [Dehalococcoidales bacterium]
METKQLADKLVSWIRYKVEAAGCKGAVFGMSGGLDSSVLAVLCQHALPRSTLGVIMPCHSSQEDVAHAHQVADKFAITTKTVALDSVCDSLLEILPRESTEPAISRLTEGNLKARLRMLVLYYLANQLKYLVIGASNRSELAIGYFTKHGDGATDIMPLGNLVKGQVRELARFLGIPEVIIEKTPSAGLWEGQSDEAELGLSYQELDHYLLSGEASEVVRKKIEAMIASSNHKRLPPQVPDFSA